MRHGGDVKGITKKLDYTKSLGFDAIWISPVFQNQENSYHGYGQVDFTVLDDRWGTLEEFREMVQEAHKRGICVIVNIVVNHMANLLHFEGHRNNGAPFRMHVDEYRVFPRDPNNTYRDFVVDNTWNPKGYYGEVYKDDGYPVYDNGGGAFSFSDFHHNRDLNDYGDPFQDHLAKIYGTMDDLRNDHPRVQAKIIAMTKSLISSVDIDGIRMDTLMQVPLSFFKNWVPAVKDHAASLGKTNFFVFGEFFCNKERSATLTGRGKTPAMFGKDGYISEACTMDGGIFYPVNFWFQQALNNQVDGYAGGLKELYDDAQKRYDFYNPKRNEWQYRHLHFYNNHDQWRLSASYDGFYKTDLGSAIITLFPGIPLFYSGDEQGFLTRKPALSE